MYYYDGTLDFWIDCFTNCLLHNESNKEVNTIIQRIARPFEQLEEYNKKKGWFVDWDTFPNDVEIYAIITPEDDNTIQGLFGVTPDEEWDSARVVWGCAAPWNTPPDVPYSTGEQRYSGIGSHIFAGGYIYSLAMGHSGGLSGFATNETLLLHYIETFGAIPHPHFYPNNPYFFTIPSDRAQSLDAIRFDWRD